MTEPFDVYVEGGLSHVFMDSEQLAIGALAAFAAVASLCQALPRQEGRPGKCHLMLLRSQGCDMPC